MITRDQLVLGKKYLYNQEGYVVDYIGQPSVVLTSSIREHVWDIEECLRYLIIPPKPKKTITLNWWMKDGDVLIKVSECYATAGFLESAWKLIKTETVEIESN